MPTPSTITCPACQAKLKVKDSSQLGMKVTCPKCKKPFVSKAPQKDAEDEFEFAPEEEDEFAAPPPPKRTVQSRPKSGQSKKKPSRSGSKLPLFIGGGVVLLIGIGIALWALLSGGTGEPVVAAAPEAAPPKNKLAIEYLPTASELFVVLRVAELYNAPLVQSLVDNPQAKEAVQKMQQETGLTPTDIETVTIGVAGLSERAAAGQQLLGAAQAMDALRTLDATVVVRLKKAVDPTALKLTEKGGALVEYQGKSYYRGSASPDDENKFAVYFPTPTLVVYGTETSVKGAIDRGDKAPYRADLEFVEPAPHLLIVGIPKDRTALGKLSPTGETSDSPLDRALREQAKAFSFGLKITQGAAVEIALDCSDSAGADKLKKEFDTSLADAQKSFTASRDKLTPALGQLGDTFMKSLATAGQKSTVRVSAAIPEMEQKQLAEIPGQLMGMLLMAQMAGGGNKTPPPNVPESAQITSKDPAPSQAPPSTAPANGPNDVIRITAGQLSREFKSNAVDALKKYFGKAIELTGKVTTVMRDAEKKLQIVLTSEDGSPAVVSCTGFANDQQIEQQVKPGQMATIRARASAGSQNEVILINCELVDVK